MRPIVGIAQSGSDLSPCNRHHLELAARVREGIRDAGGVAHGVGNALFEWMKYDRDGQPLTTTFQDYLLPGALDVPPCAIEHVETPNPLNPLGVKGAGEGGTIPTPAAIISAVEDALSPFGVRFAEMPLTPDRIVDALRKAGAYETLAG